MPNYDAGHYFLTALAPIRMDSILKNGQSHSRRHLIRERLAAMPTAESTLISAGQGDNNPFARCTRTHFARFVVLDDVVFNGRVSGDTLLDLVRDRLRRPPTDPLTSQPDDRLSTPFLIFVADFDAASGADPELRSYLTDLWKTMRDELRGIFEHCVGFERIDTAEAFCDYLTKCQIETTMPFNDYWAAPLVATDFDFKPYLMAAVAAVAGLGLVTLLTDLHRVWFFVLTVVILALVLIVLYWNVMAKAKRPFPKSPPPAPSSDLPSVLKALYLQRGFTELAIRVQGARDQALHEEFGKFIIDYKPADIAGPTQPPGVIGANRDAPR
jgi:hypothetical protein